MELQSKVDFSMPFRLLVYMVDIWEQYFRNVAEEDAILDTNTVIDNVFYLDRAKDTSDFLKAVGSIMDRVGALPPDERNLMEVWFDNVLSGMFGEKEREFIRDCFMRGEKEMISGFEQIMIEEREQAESRGQRRGEEIGQRRGEEIGQRRGEEIGQRRGEEKEREEGIRRMIELCAELSLSHGETVAKLLGKYELSREAARKYVDKFWPSDAAGRSAT